MDNATEIQNLGYLLIQLQEQIKCGLTPPIGIMKSVIELKNNINYATEIRNLGYILMQLQEQVSCGLTPPIGIMESVIELKNNIQQATDSLERK